MIKVSLVVNNSHHDVIKIQYHKLNIDRIVDSWFFFDSSYLKNYKSHLAKSEIFATYLLSNLNKIIEMNVGEKFILLYDISDQYSEGVQLQRNLNESFTLQRVITTRWGCMNPWIIMKNQLAYYQEEGDKVSENRTEFIIGMLRSIDSLIKD